MAHRSTDREDLTHSPAHHCIAANWDGVQTSPVVAQAGYDTIANWDGAQTSPVVAKAKTSPSANTITEALGVEDHQRIRVALVQGQWGWSGGHVSNMDRQHCETGITATCDRTTPRQHLQSVSSMVQQHAQLVVMTPPIRPAPEQDWKVICSVLLAHQDPASDEGTSLCQPKFCSNIPLMGTNVFTAFLSTFISQHNQVKPITSEGGPHVWSSAIASLDHKCCNRACNFLDVDWSGLALLSGAVHSGGKQHVPRQGLTRKAACCSAMFTVNVGQGTFVFQH